jgi:uncharacterized protein YbjT (DUF2867 family)
MYLVTGATGNVGREVVTQLLSSGEGVRVFTRNREIRWADRVEIALGDFQRPDTFVRALAGVEAVFLMHESQDPGAIRGLVAAAKVAGDPRIVFLSSLSANTPQLQIGDLHKRNQDAIRESGLHGTFLRPGGFMSNSCRWIDTIKMERVVYNALGDTKFPPIAPEDIAAVAVKALTDRSLPGEVYELTGGESLNVAEQVIVLARVLGKPIRCVDVSVEVAVENLIRRGLPRQMVEAVGETFQAVRSGRAELIYGGALKDTVQRVTGRQPLTFESWARKHAAQFA